MRASVPVVSNSTAPTAGAGPDERPTLKKLLEVLGSDLVEVVATPHGIDVPVHEPVIYDATERHAIVPGAVRSKTRAGASWPTRT